MKEHLGGVGVPPATPGSLSSGVKLNHTPNAKPCRFGDLCKFRRGGRCRYSHEAAGARPTRQHQTFEIVAPQGVVVAIAKLLQSLTCSYSLVARLLS